MSAAIVTLALLLDTLLGEPRRWHPLVGFGRYASFLESTLNRRDAAPAAGRLRGIAALLLAVLPFVAASLLIPRALQPLTDIALLYLAIGHRSLRDHALRVHAALQAQDLPLARGCVAQIVSRDTAGMDASRVAGATVESVLENGADAVFGALFWFAVAGAPGVLLYRLANTLDAMWGYRTPRYACFGWAAARFDDLLNWLPARLTALSYALLARRTDALRCWREQAPAWESPNAGPVMASGAGGLGLSLGGPAFYHGQWKPRPPLGCGVAPQAHDIPRSLALVLRALLLWLALWWLAAFAWSCTHA